MIDKRRTLRLYGSVSRRPFFRLLVASRIGDVDRRYAEMKPSWKIGRAYRKQGAFAGEESWKKLNQFG